MIPSFHGVWQCRIVEEQGETSAYMNHADCQSTICQYANNRFFGLEEPYLRHKNIASFDDIKMPLYANVL